MSTQSASRKAQIGIAFLKEAILDVLADSQARGEEYVIMGTFQSRLGMFGTRNYHLILNTAHMLTDAGEVEEIGSSNQRRWRLPLS